MLDPLTLLVDLLAVYRISRLIVKDSLLNEVRWWILRRWPGPDTVFPADQVINIATVKVDGEEIRIAESKSGYPLFFTEDGWLSERPRKFGELISCPFCVSMWVSFAVLALRVWWVWWQYPALALGLAGGVALIFSKWDTE